MPQNAHLDACAGSDSKKRESSAGSGACCCLLAGAWAQHSCMSLASSFIWRAQLGAQRAALQLTGWMPRRALRWERSCASSSSSSLAMLAELFTYSSRTSRVSELRINSSKVS